MFDRDWLHGIAEGWHPLVIQLDADISALAPDYEVYQIKEKFGGLRYYIGPVASDVFDRVYELIDTAERASYTLCEICGEQGSLHSRGYYVRTVCSACAEQGGYKPHSWYDEDEEDDEPTE